MKRKCHQCGNRDEFEIVRYPVRGDNGQFAGTIWLCDDCALSLSEDVQS